MGEVYNDKWNYHIKTIELIISEIIHNKSLSDSYMILQNMDRYNKLTRYQMETIGDLTEAVNNFNEYLKGIKISIKQQVDIDRINDMISSLASIVNIVE